MILSRSKWMTLLMSRRHIFIKKTFPGTERNWEEKNSQQTKDYWLKDKRIHVHIKLKRVRNLELKENKLGPKADLQWSTQLKRSLSFRFSKFSEKQSTSQKSLNSLLKNTDFFEHDPDAKTSDYMNILVSLRKFSPVIRRNTQVKLTMHW